MTQDMDPNSFSNKDAEMQQGAKALAECALQIILKMHPKLKKILEESPTNGRPRLPVTVVAPISMGTAV